MERLTFDGIFCDIAQCTETPGGSFCEDGYCSQRKVWERLKQYEDTGLMPGDVKELLDMAVSKTDKVLRLKEELHTIKNELCRYCGKYKQAHEGTCDWCKWMDM
jgi:hypothetical protein|uniref:Uncharacterized protein n=1 Tax=Siphoviridae sp. ctB9N2 TaxID=2826188 RepID=A0A8S5NGP7_9CAUD|nr:MAG TPA: hypothetical protein [Siphoviridae sp. ctB9N2]